MSRLDLGELLREHGSELVPIADALIKGETARDAIVRLTISLATGHAAAGELAAFASRTIAEAFSSSADKFLREQLRDMEKDEERRAFLANIDAIVAELIFQAVHQLANRQDRGTESLLGALGQFRAEFDRFRSDFVGQLGAAVTIRAEQIVSHGGVGVEVGPATRQRVVLRRQVVSGRGSIGIVLK